jgi:hypothetical protein
MRDESARRQPLPAPQRPLGVRWVVYWCGRTLQALGLVLIVEVLLLFAGTPGMGLLLEWSMVAALVFYAGWACTIWAKGKGRR